FSYPDGRLVLWGEPAPGDVYYFGSDVAVPTPGSYTLRLASAADFQAWVDGKRVVSRQEVDRPQPVEWTVPLRLAAGRHRVLVKLARGGERGDAEVYLYRDDGAPA